MCLVLPPSVRRAFLRIFHSSDEGADVLLRPLSIFDEGFHLCRDLIMDFLRLFAHTRKLVPQCAAYVAEWLDRALQSFLGRFCLRQKHVESTRNLSELAVCVIHGRIVFLKHVVEMLRHLPHLYLHPFCLGCNPHKMFRCSIRTLSKRISHLLDTLRHRLCSFSLYLCCICCARCDGILHLRHCRGQCAVMLLRHAACSIDIRLYRLRNLLQGCGKRIQLCTRPLAHHISDLRCTAAAEFSKFLV